MKCKLSKNSLFFKNYLKKIVIFGLILSWVFAGFPQIFNFPPEIQEAQAAGWLTDWNKRIKITTDQTDIDADLTDFPILVYLSSSSGRNSDDVTAVFTEVGANSKKIAVTTSDGTTQCYVEIEKWDYTGTPSTSKAWLWVKAPSVSGTVDTDFYLYYDNDQADNTTYVGAPNSTPAENVWDTNSKLVTHMRDDPDNSHIRDSTSNNNDGTKKAAGEPAVTTSGKIDDAQDFDGVDDYVQSSNNVSITGNSSRTTECWIYVTKTDNWQHFFQWGDETTETLNTIWGLTVSITNTWFLWGRGGGMIGIRE